MELRSLLWVFQARRDALTAALSEAGVASPVCCPCCGFPGIDARGDYDICGLFQLTGEEFEALRSQSVISKPIGRGGRRGAPYAFTEQGVAMLSSVLHSARAIQVNIEIVRAFVRLRQLLLQNADLARKLAALEKKHDAQFKVVFDAIRDLMAPPSKVRRPIGFAATE